MSSWKYILISIHNRYLLSITEKNAGRFILSYSPKLLLIITITAAVTKLELAEENGECSSTIRSQKL